MEDNKINMVETGEGKTYEELKTPKWLKYIFGTIAYGWALLFTLSQIKVLAEIFKESIGVGLLVLLSGVGVGIVMSPALISWLAPSALVEWGEEAQTKGKMYMRLIFGYLGIFAGSLLANLLVTLLIAWLLY